MAKKQSASTVKRIASQFANVDAKQHIKSLEESRFFQRLNACSKHPGVSALITTVQKVWDLVDDVTKRVSQDFRDYTLHDMKHLGNVLWLMEQLVPPALWEKPWTAGQPVGPFQCAVSILALLVHDLGMALPDDTRKKLLAVEDPERTLAEAIEPLDRDVIAYRRHFMAQEHDVRTMQTLERDKPDHYRDRVEHIRQQIRTEYLRQTHADDAIGGEHRIQTWLQDFNKSDGVSFQHANQSFLKQIAQVALSHGQSLAWLAGTFGDKGRENWTTDEAIDWLWTGWLLRLGDILDFDASRAPRVLFRQFRPSDPTSVKHWYQHLCIGQRVFQWNNQAYEKSAIVFRKSDTGCPNPDILKGVSDYCGWIRQELAGVSKASQERTDSLPLRLPGHTEQHVKHDLQIEGGWDSQPVKFELSQDQVVRILMGEELYGEPSLCLRELVQNSLDALHLRWLRSELRRRVYEKHQLQPGLGVREPVELDGLEPVDLVEDQSKLGIKVSWGEAELEDDRWPNPDGSSRREPRHFIDIEDNGVGMTFDVVKRYFTQIGKSYYQSPEYSRERALMREFSLPVSEISQFGIGILSCFMLADLVEVWTCPSAVDHGERQPHHLKIWGPDGLFWHQAISNATHVCGTRIRMWLRAGTEARCQPDNLMEELKSYHFGSQYSGLTQYAATSNEGRTEVDPLRAIWSVTAWPRFAIQFEQPPATEAMQRVPNEVCLLDDLAVLRVLAKLDDKRIADRFRVLAGDKEMSIPVGLDSIAWQVWDWEDLATASRIRIAVPVRGTNNKITRASSVSQLFETAEEDFPIETLRRALAETLLDSDGRTRWIIRGMALSEIEGLDKFLTFGNGVGTCCVVDLSGHAAPGLKSDRTSLKRTQRKDWSPEVRQLTERWKSAVASGQFNLSTLRSLQHGVTGREMLLPSAKSKSEWQLPQWPNSVATATRLLILEIASALDVAVVLVRTGKFASGDELARARDIDLVRDFLRDLGSIRDLRSALERDFASDLGVASALALPARGIAGELAGALVGPRDRDRARVREIRRGIGCRLIRLAVSPLKSHFLGEGCYPDLRQSAPVLALPDCAGEFIDGQLTAPIALRFETQMAGDGTHATIRSSKRWNSPAWLEALDYDLVAPFTLLPLGELQNLVPEWGIDRQLRRIGMLPFLVDHTIVWEQFRPILPEVGFSEAFVESGSILLLIPGDELLRKPFVEWDQQRDAAFVVSALWDVPHDRVLWAEGFHNRDSIRQVGKPLSQWLAEAQTSENEQ